MSAPLLMIHHVFTRTIELLFRNPYPRHPMDVTTHYIFGY